MKNIEIFISYKRDGGSVWAELVRLGLIHYTSIRPESIFLDVHDLTEEWKVKIKSTIRQCTNVIVVISKDFEKKIHHEDDWFIEEINEAIQHKRVIIPLLVDGITEDSITSNNNIPDIIKDIVNSYQYVEYHHGELQSAIDKLKAKFLDSSDLKVFITIVSDQKCFVRLPKPDNRTHIINESNHFCLREFSIDRGFNGELTFKAWQEEPYKEIYHHLYIGSSPPFEQNMDNFSVVEDLSKESDITIEFNWLQMKITDVATRGPAYAQVMINAARKINE